jgi:hypothetical protein
MDVEVTSSAKTDFMFGTQTGIVASLASKGVRRERRDEFELSSFFQNISFYMIFVWFMLPFAIEILNYV